ncbi:hypothetical protein FNF27_02682 [Cafeteria roenbergensis]|uniref:WD repeat-containing protein 54 beta-propeller domain-containing protein n=1 Tax=Cafeteria roenbergensis TaxID=33653 RepID=A0A5A8CC65_CAFRO|nr:hypothetical protein FNF31_07740 [Cafeteria roenbergensis]KAA0150562.1 hypothetical protein FNF29_05137 [Cafeteria roenbergensis]KAA0155054.1 hypothetical protein FNF28_06765 [Cafeteria roenbergensis]KAA0175961.1 hypothetical protein FNF27_02682 [Cafeteria roenbergensis]|eukprot:KAA0150562.1 hypothetical protein FNF29_05137 [Cafeteria roenbergensis]
MAASGSAKRYDVGNMQSIRLTATNPVTGARFSPTPSMLFNNLSASPSDKALTFVHKGMAVSVDGSVVGGDNTTNGKAIRLGASVGTGAKWVALGASPLLVVTTEANFQIWDGAGDHLLFFAGATDGVAAEPSRSGLQSPMAAASRASAAAGPDGGSHVASLAASAPCRGVGASHVARTVIVGCGSDLIVAQAEADLKTFSMLPRVRAHDDAEVTDLSVDESGVKLVTGASDGTVGIWDARVTSKLGDVEPLAADGGVTAPIASVLVRGDLIAAADVLGRLRLIRYSSQKTVAVVNAHPRAITALALHPREFLFATASEDAVIKLWAMPEAAAGGSRVEHRGSLELTDHPITGLAFANDGSLAAASFDVVHLRVLRAS